MSNKLKSLLCGALASVFVFASLPSFALPDAKAESGSAEKSSATISAPSEAEATFEPQLEDPELPTEEAEPEVTVNREETAAAAKAADQPIEPYWTVPSGYNAHDYNKIVSFLEQTDENGVKNGEKLSDSYDPNDPGTWGLSSFFTWTTVNGELRIARIDIYGSQIDDRLLYGSLDVSDCAALTYLYCSDNHLTELDVSGCTALTSLYCFENFILAELDVSGCAALTSLGCGENNLTELDVSGCVALTHLDCYGNYLTELDVSKNTALYCLDCCRNNLTELDVSNNTALHILYCSYNRLTKLDVSNNSALIGLECYSGLTELNLSNNPYLPLELIKAEGNGSIGYRKYGWNDYCIVYADPAAGATFLGWYNAEGELIASPDDCVYDYYYNQYRFQCDDNNSTVLIARFEGSEPVTPTVPGDADGDGAVNVVDALTALRMALGLTDNGNSSAVDMDGNGSISVIDALAVLRIAMGLA